MRLTFRKRKKIFLRDRPSYEARIGPNLVGVVSERNSPSECYFYVMGRWAGDGPFNTLVQTYQGHTTWPSMDAAKAAFRDFFRENFKGIR